MARLLEEETIILLNRGDLDQGYFQFGTSRKDHHEKMLRRLAKLGLTPLETKTSIDRETREISWYQSKLPKAALSREHFGIKGK